MEGDSLIFFTLTIFIYNMITFNLQLIINLNIIYLKLLILISRQQIADMTRITLDVYKQYTDKKQI